MSESTKESIKGLTGALVITALFLAAAAFIVGDPGPTNCPNYGAAGTTCVGK